MGVGMVGILRLVGLRWVPVGVGIALVWLQARGLVVQVVTMMVGLVVVVRRTSNAAGTTAGAVVRQRRGRGHDKVVFAVRGRRWRWRGTRG